MKKGGRGAILLPPAHAKRLGSRSQKASRFSPCALCLCGKSVPFKNLPPLSRLFALFSALPSFVFNGLQPLLAKYRGWGIANSNYGTPGWGWWVADPPAKPSNTARLLTRLISWSGRTGRFQDRTYWKFVTAICATFFARSNVALRLPPINRTLPVTS
jgi:hypothetical protein